MDLEIGARIRRARLARKPKMTLAQLAGTRLSISLVSKIERGQVWPSVPTLGYLAERLELPLASLFESADRPSASSRSVPGAGSFARAEAYLGLGDSEAALALLDEQAMVSDVPSAPVAALRALALLASGRLDEAVAAAQAIEARSVGMVEDWPSSRQDRPRPGGDAADGREESTAPSWPSLGTARVAGQAPVPAPTGWSRDRDESEAKKARRTILSSSSSATSASPRFNDDAFAQARAAFVIGEVARQRGRDAAAVDGFRRCLRTPGTDVRWIDLRSRALRALAALHDDRGDAETARNLYRQAAALLAQLTHPRQRAARWLRLAESLARAGDHAEANLAVARAAELAALVEGGAVRLDVDARLDRLAMVAGGRATSGDRALRVADSSTSRRAIRGRE